MLIGTDFDKIQWTPFGLDLVEPNAMIGDALLFIISLYFAYRTKKLGLNTPFFNYWYWFFIVFGIGFFLGGLGHLLYNYTGVPGKYPSWYIGIFAIYLMENAMISIFQNERLKKLFAMISNIKFGLALIAATLVFSLVDLTIDPSIGLKVPSVNSLIGILGCLGVLAYTYIKQYSPQFKFHVISILTMVPAAIAQTFKVNFHQWFDRNDLSHVFLALSICLYFVGIKGYFIYLSKNR